MDGLVPHLLREVGVAAEATQLGPGGGAAGTELEAPVRDDVKGGGPLSGAGRVVEVRQHDGDTLPDADALRAGGGGGEEDFGRGAVGVLLEEMVLDGPCLVEPKLVGELDLRERVVVDLALGIGTPWAADGELVEDAEFHGVVNGSTGTAELEWLATSRVQVCTHCVLVCTYD